MPAWNHDHYDRALLADRLLHREAERLTAGACAFHQIDPREAVMRLEEERAGGGSEDGNLRAEIFSGLAEYLFADGPAPGAVRERMAAVASAFHPALSRRIHGPQEWCDPAAVSAVLARHAGKLREQQAAASSRASLASWCAALATERDAEYVAETLVGLLEWIASEGTQWRHLVAATYCLAKALRPALIAGMPLHDIAILSGDEGGRATPCNRIKRLVNRRMAEGGARGTSVHFNKAAATVRKYRAAQMGNRNRGRARKRKP